MSPSLQDWLLSSEYSPSLVIHLGCLDLRVRSPETLDPDEDTSPAPLLSSFWLFWDHLTLLILLEIFSFGVAVRFIVSCELALFPFCIRHEAEVGVP